jgi:spore coat polysaccharide biosynthesis protein SpsF
MNNPTNFGVILQARMSSTRCPGKVGILIARQPMLYHQLQRVKQCGIQNIVVATSNHESDDIIEKIAKDCKVECYRGSLDNVLERYHAAAVHYKIRTVIRVCGDDPLIDPACIDALVSAYETKPADYIYSGHPNGWIYGTTAELIEFHALERALLSVTDKSDKEHVVPFIKRNGDMFTKYRISPTNKELVRPDIFLTVDYPEDMATVSQIITELDSSGKLYGFTQEDLIDMYDSGRINITNKHLHDGFGE